MRKASICIIAYNSYGALCGGEAGHIGGAERQTSLMARWFAAAGHETSMITWGDAKTDGQRVAGVTVRTATTPEAGLPGLRFFHPRLTGLRAAMHRANAEIYYHNAAEAITGLAASWCHRNDRKFVYSAAAELACDVRLPLTKRPYERWLYRRGVRLAHLRIVQTQTQQRLLREGWNLASVVLPMPCPGPEDSEVTTAVSQPPRILWVGRIDDNKRLDWFLDVAAKVPSARFEIAAADNGSLVLTARLRERAAGLSNVVWRGPIAREAMPDFYRGATCLCCTSMHEGFPNIFIEAWSHGVPVVTTFDPDRLVMRLGLGRAASDVNGLASAINAFCSDASLHQKTSKQARAYYTANHRVEVAMTRFQAELNHLALPEAGVAGTASLPAPGLGASSSTTR